MGDGGSSVDGLHVRCESDDLSRWVFTSRAIMFKVHMWSSNLYLKRLFIHFILKNFIDPCLNIIGQSQPWHWLSPLHPDHVASVTVSYDDFIQHIREKRLISHIRKNINNRSLQCCNSTHVHLLLITHNNSNMWRPRVANSRTTENGRLGINLASLMASLWAWNILTLFMLDCQYFTYPPWSAVSIHMSLWDQVMARTGLSWACRGQRTCWNHSGPSRWQNADIITSTSDIVLISLP